VDSAGNVVNAEDREKFAFVIVDAEGRAGKWLGVAPMSERSQIREETTLVPAQ